MKNNSSRKFPICKSNTFVYKYLLKKALLCAPINVDNSLNNSSKPVFLKQEKVIFGKPYERFIQVINATNHVNPLTYQYRTKTNQLTNETMGLERAAIPMFPLMITFGW